MPPKVAGAVRNVRKAKTAIKVDHRNRVFTHIPAQMASAAPPLGTQLGNVGINIAAFVKDFNLRTSIFREGLPIPCNITVNADRSYNLRMNHPPWSYFIFQAAGISRGAMDYRTQTAGYITRKHVYEIAKIKQQEDHWQEFDLKTICEEVIDRAYFAGVKVVDHLDPVEYGKFLEERRKIVEQEVAEVQAAKEAKLLRT